MEAAMTLTTTLSKWGNSQGFRLPKEVCELLGIELGAEACVSVNASESQVTLTFDKPKRSFRRTRKVTIEDLFEGYEGAYEPPADWPTNGNEIDWGEPVGKEVW